jgi:aminoglycoside adenylyltransferase-like protein
MSAPVAEYLSELALRLEAHLGRRLAGAWLIGSGALGDFDGMRSDVDVQAVSTTRLTRTELERLVAALSHPALRCPVRGLEFVLYARDDLSGSQGPAFQLNLNTGPRMEHHVGYDPDAEPRFWFVLDTAIARERARPLAGISPSALLPPSSRPLVLSALREALAWYRAYDGAEAVLAACRAWAWASQGRWLSKGDAAAWAAAQLPDPAPVSKALARRADPASAGPTPSEVEGVLDPVERLLAGRAHRPAPAQRKGSAPNRGRAGQDLARQAAADSQFG